MFAILKINTTCKKCKNHFLVDTYVVHMYILYVAAKLLFQSDFFHFKLNMNKTTVLAFYHLILSKT